MFSAVSDGPAFLYAEVVDGKNIRPAEAEDQEHFNGPGADAADGDEAFDEFFIGEFFGFFECRDDAPDRLFGEILHGQDFCAGKARFAEDLAADFEHLLGRGNSPFCAERFDATEDGGGSLAGDGLVGDGFEERFVGRLVRFHFGLEGSRSADEFGQRLVAGAEMLNCGVEIERKCGWLVDHWALL